MSSIKKVLKMNKKELEKITNEFINNDWGEKAKWVEYFGIDRKRYLRWLLKRKVKKSRCCLIRGEYFGLESIKHALNKVICVSDSDGCLAGFAMRQYKIRYRDTLSKKPRTAHVCIGKVLYQQG